MLFLGLLRPLVPLLCIVAGYLLWLGAFAPGGAFQAGAVLSGALLLLIVARLPQPPVRRDSLALRLIIALGLSMFVGVAATTAAIGRALLQYPPGLAKDLILLIEGALTLAVAFTFVILFLGGRPPERWDRPS